MKFKTQQCLVDRKHFQGQMLAVIIIFLISQTQSMKSDLNLDIAQDSKYYTKRRKIEMIHFSIHKEKNTFYCPNYLAYESIL